MGCGATKLQTMRSLVSVSMEPSLSPEAWPLLNRKKWGEWEDLVQEGVLARSELLLLDLLEHVEHWSVSYHWCLHYQSLISLVYLAHGHLWLQSLIVLFPHQRVSLCIAEDKARELLARVQRLAFERIMEEQYVSWLISGGLEGLEASARHEIMTSEHCESEQFLWVAAVGVIVHMVRGHATVLGETSASDQKYLLTYLLESNV